ncbi:MAG: glutamate-cysteine ligase family protein [Patescibacteria group bacterium]
MKQSFRTLGIEDEGFIVKDGIVIPRVADVLQLLVQGCLERNLLPTQFSTELFAGQIEVKSVPCSNVDELFSQIKVLRNYLSDTAVGFGASIMHVEFVPEDELGQLLVNPCNDRHLRLWQTLDYSVRVAASQVASFQIHVGVTPDEAVRILKYANESVVRDLLELGDNSEGKRLKAYTLVTHESGFHPSMSTISELYRHTYRNNFNPKDNWDWIRWKPSTHTLEFRMFGTHEDLSVLRSYVDAVLYLVSQAL